ncbi:MAG TPA: tetratricopeptide repeat protein [Blastocatellia bacterium]|nr:tetratricopeptide repeat protein [Blastocatellia bacterium]
MAITFTAVSAHAALLQSGPHRIVGHLIGHGGSFQSIRVRLIREDGNLPVADAVTLADGQFTFSQIMEGNYLVTVDATDQYQAVTISVEIRAIIKSEGTTVRVVVPMTPKEKPALAAPAGASIPADVDLNVPQAARDHYNDGVRAEEAGQSARSVAAYRDAIRVYPDYYASRLALARELRRQKDFKGALDVLEPLRTIAPKHAEPLIEIGVVKLALAQPNEAASVLTEAIALNEQSWVAHLYLGYSLLGANDEQAESHFWRALKIDPVAAAEAHLALARLAHKYGYPKDAVEQIDAYLAAVPNAPNGPDIRKLREKLASELQNTPHPDHDR